MKFYLTVFLLCLTQVKGQTLLNPEQEKAQYGVVKNAAEATIFRMRSYSVAVEMNYPVKIINQQIINKLVELAIEETVVDEIREEMVKQAVSINDNILLLMDYCQDLIDTLEKTNPDIVANEPETLELDLAKMNSEMNSINLTYDLGGTVIEGGIEIISLRIQLAIAGNDDPIAAEIEALLTEAETILNTEYQAMAASKSIFDVVANIAITSLEELIATHSATTTTTTETTTVTAPP